jgi:hypothetical protein
LFASPWNFDTSRFSSGLGVNVKKQEKKLFVIAGEGTLIFHVRIPQMHVRDDCPQSKIATFCESFDRLLAKWRFTYLKHLYDELVVQMETSYKELEYHLHTLSHPSRSKRGLVDFFGDMASALFGVATEKDLKVLYSRMQSLYKTAGHVQTDIRLVHDELKSVAKGLDSRIKAVVSTVNTTAILVGNIGIKLMQLQRYEHAKDRTFDFAIPVLLYTLQKHKGLQDWLSALKLLKSGILPEYLVSFPQLRESLAKLSTSMGRYDANLRIPDSDDQIMKLYQLRTSKALVMNDDLFIITKVPSLYQHTLTAFHFQSFPVFAHATNVFTQLQIDDPYLAVTSTGEEFVSLSRTDYEYCENNAFICLHINTIASNAKPTCPYAILVGYSESAIKDLCVFQVLRLPPRFMISRLSAATYYVVSGVPTDVRIICADTDPLSLSAVGSQIVRLKCGCAIHAKQLRTLPSICNTNVTTTIHFPLNYAILRNSSADASYLQHLLNATSDTEIQVDLPAIQELVARSQALLHQSKNLSELVAPLTSLREVADKTHLRFDEFADLPPVDLSPGWPLLNFNTMNIIFTIWLIILSMFTFMFVLRLNVIKAAILASLPTARALPVTVPTLPTWHERDHVEGVFKLIFVLTSLIFSIRMLVKCFSCVRTLCKIAHKHCQRYFPAPISTKFADVYLKLSSSGRQVVVFLQAVPYEPNQTIFTSVPKAVTLAIDSSVGSSLALSWDGPLVYTLNGHINKIYMPLKVRIHRTIATSIAVFLADEDTGGHIVNSLLYDLTDDPTNGMVPISRE